MTEHDADMEARDAAGVQLLHETFARWRDMPPATLTLPRVNAWTVLLALQVAVRHPGLVGTNWASAIASVGRQVQEAVSDSPEIHADAERGWAEDTDTPGLGSGPDPSPDQVRLMTDAYARWQSMEPVTVRADLIDVWAVIMGLQVAFSHPDIAGTAMGPVVESVGRQLQEAVCDSPELYALTEAGWNRAADVDAGDGQ